jgi:hypothetical protein
MSDELLEKLQRRLSNAAMVGTPAGETDVASLTPSAGALDTLRVTEQRKNIDARKAELTELLKSGFEELNAIEGMAKEQYLVEPPKGTLARKIMRLKRLNPYWQQEQELNFQRVKSQMWVDTAREVRGLANELRMLDPEMNAAIEALGRGAAARANEIAQIKHDTLLTELAIGELVSSGIITAEQAEMVRPAIRAKIGELPSLNETFKDEADTRKALHATAVDMTDDEIEAYGKYAASMKRARGREKSEAERKLTPEQTEDFLKEKNLRSWWEQREKDHLTILKSAVKLPTETEEYEGATGTYSIAKTHNRVLPDDPALLHLAQLKTYRDLTRWVSGNVGQGKLKTAISRLRGTLPDEILSEYDEGPYADYDEGSWLKEADIVRLGVVGKVRERAGLKELTPEQKEAYRWVKLNAAQ